MHVCDGQTANCVNIRISYNQSYVRRAIILRQAASAVRIVEERETEPLVDERLSLIPPTVQTNLGQSR
jgi:hypothetical protein